MVVGQDKERMGHINFLINQARDESKSYVHPEIGFNYRMTNLEAALGLAQLERLPDFLKQKQLIREIYKEELGQMDCLQFQEETAGGENVWWLTSIRLKKKTDLAKLEWELNKEMIPVRRIFTPLVECPPFVQHKRSACKNSYEIYEHGLSLPSSTLNDEEGIRHVCQVIRKGLGA